MEVPDRDPVGHRPLHDLRQLVAGPRVERSDPAGFTLVEILVVLLLLTVAMVGLAGLQLNAIRQVSVNSRSGEATRLAQSLLERHMAMSFVAIQNQFNEQTSLFPSINPADTSTWPLLLRKDGLTEMRNVHPDGETAGGQFTARRYIAMFSNAYVITTRVTWTESSGTDRGVQLSLWREL